ncbi:PLC-like phosphodiesterase, TIM beta/alpha-barrel domain protein [Ophiocordyceps camponoti-floridani]|uniref:PLC-like phosphodiesterase, TIM beta/alpha-barrel domain protein n=1 Tax=Ophiocordyceps camponoti-floridani TaxID=2030778 RepID=A0A8H4VBV4_9HYPO|nr:PLC-like phosphodiesterase, TIM beta/alpha-barrel domain protein [Ophiocordyceps camponoti-floridani]
MSRLGLAIGLVRLSAALFMPAGAAAVPPGSGQATLLAEEPWAPLPAAAPRTACNGHAKLCERKYSDVTMIGTHNSAFVGDTPFHNQFVSLTEQLDMGVRFLTAQTHNRLGRIELCHTSCWELDVGPLSGYLHELAHWMDQHPDDVVTLLLTNMDAIPTQRFDKDLAAAGLTKYAFRPGGRALGRDGWPTMGQLLDEGTRLLVFMDYHADLSQTDYIMPEFDYFWETPYGITDDQFPTCSVDRPSGGDAGRLMGLMNHMLNFKLGDIVFPNMLDAARTNSLASIQKQVELCKSQGKPQPKVVLLDWANIGEAQKAQQVLNAL